MKRNELLERINSNPYLTREAKRCMYLHKTFAIVKRIDNSVDCFIKTLRGANGYINRQVKAGFYDKDSEFGKDIIEIKESEIEDINSKAVWYRYIVKLVNKGLSLDTTTVNPEGYCDNQNTIDFVNCLVKNIKNNNYKNVPTFEQAETMEVITPVSEPKEEKKNSICTINFAHGKIIVTPIKDILDQNKETQQKMQILAHNGFTYDFENKIFYADDNDFMKNLLIKLGFMEDKIISVRKTRKEPFQIKERNENQNIEKNNSENKPVEEKDVNTNTKNVIFVDFKQAKKKNVAPEKQTIKVFDKHFLTNHKAKVNNPDDTKLSIAFINEQNQVSICNDWKTATKIYNKLITFTILSEKELNLKVSIKKYGEVIKQTITINKDTELSVDFKRTLLKNVNNEKKTILDKDLIVSEAMELCSRIDNKYELLSCF